MLEVMVDRMSVLDVASQLRGSPLVVALTERGRVRAAQGVAQETDKGGDNMHL